ncbi:MAG TPA: universal stress protein [Bryobacteraceae bacterium]|nr:universal stress protein [Bryobacteraceae bacterium]
MRGETRLRPDPDQLLRSVENEDFYEKHGRLKVFLGYASGVGKSFRMFDEGRRRFERGQDVVIAALQPNLSPDVTAIVERLPAIPPLIIDGRPVIDVEAILRRHPRVCLIDGLAFDNPCGSRNEKRWQDVQQLIDARISVITSVNLQYIEEERDRVAAITGKRAQETVPESFLENADEIMVVDAPADFNAAGGSLSPEKLSALRELALVVAAHVVERELERYLARHGIQQQWGTQERILVCITPRSNAEKIIESARRNAERFHGELFVAWVGQPELAPEDEAALQRNLEMARRAGAKVHSLEGGDPADVIMRFAREERITQIFIGHTRRTGFWARMFGSPVDDLIREAEGMDVRIFPQ